MDLSPFKKEIKSIFDYMNLYQEIKHCDVIIGCGCTNQKIPVICSDLYKKGFSNKIIFTGGYGKVTKSCLEKPESVIYKEIALREGVDEADIYLDTESSNTSENFLFSKKIMEENQWDIHSILVVHAGMYERRTFNTAKAVFKEQEILITSENLSFDEYFSRLQAKDEKKISADISVFVGNVQRMLVYPQFGLQIEDKVPQDVIDSYYKLKSLGFDDYILSKEEINSLAKQFEVKEKDILYFE